MPKIAVKPAELAARLSNSRSSPIPSRDLAEIIDSLPDPAYLLDRSHRWVYANRAYCDYVGVGSNALIGATSADILTPAEAAAAWDSDEAAFSTGAAVINESLGGGDSSNPRILQTSKTVIQADTDRPFLFGVVRDLTGTDEASALLRGAGETTCRTRERGRGLVRFVFSDPLTRLPNRHAAMNSIDALAAHAVAENAVIVFNIDHFALVNERLGHAAGDAAIVEVARRLRGAIGADTMLGRLDNDEFVIVAEHCDSMHADLIAEKILAAMVAPMQLGNCDYRLSASIGIALMPEHGRSAAELVRNAGIAMRWCKQRRRGGSELFSETVSIAAERRATIELGLPTAIEAGNLVVHYQPFVDSATGRVRGFEALARWHDAELGDIAPSEFVPIAEGMGTIRRIGQFVLGEACAAIAKLADASLSVSVNVSSVQLLDETFPIFVAEALQHSALCGEQLILEITETAAMEADAAVLQVLKELSDLGVRLLIDDFGTGYSNLARLKTLPFTGIKIDRTFVRGLPQVQADAAIFRATHAIAEALDLSIVVEGIENDAQDAFVRQFNVDYLQGYRYGRPLPAGKLKRYTR